MIMFSIMKAQLAEDFPLLCHSLPFYFLNISPVTLKIEVAQFSCNTRKWHSFDKYCSLYTFAVAALSSTFYRPASWGLFSLWWCDKIWTQCCQVFLRIVLPTPIQCWPAQFSDMNCNAAPWWRWWYVMSLLIGKWQTGALRGHLSSLLWERKNSEWGPTNEPPCMRTHSTSIWFSQKTAHSDSHTFYILAKK